MSSRTQSDLHMAWAHRGVFDGPLSISTSPDTLWTDGSAPGRESEGKAYVGGVCACECVWCVFTYAICVCTRTGTGACEIEAVGLLGRCGEAQGAHRLGLCPLGRSPGRFNYLYMDGASVWTEGRLALWEKWKLTLEPRHMEST